MFHRQSSLVAILLLVVALLTACRSEEERQIRQFEKGVEQIRQDLHNVGLVVVLVKDNRVAYSQAFGLKSVETGERLRVGERSSGMRLEKQDLFRIASISKSFTTTSLLQLAEQGRVSLQDDVNDLIGFTVRNPRFPDVPITLEMLLSHTSSLNDGEDYFTLDVLNPATNPNYVNCYNDYAPGQGYEYCNLNLNLAGALLERLSGERFDCYVQNHVLRPLGFYGGYCVDSLDRSLLVPLYHVDEDGTPHLSEDAYRPLAGRLDGYRPGYDTPLFSPTGGMKISATGLARYMLMHINYGTSPEGVRIISPEAARDMQRPRSADENYGLTLWQTDEYSPGTTLTGHTGSAYGLRSAMFFNPEGKYGFVVISNGAIEDDEDAAAATDPSGSPSDRRNILTRVLRLMYETFVGKNR